MKLWGTALVLGLAVGACAAQSAKVLTAAQALDVHRISDLHFSPDGARLAYTVGEPPHGSDNFSHIWVMDVARRTSRQFTFSDKSETSPRWSPDGTYLAFLANRGEGRQIYLLPAAMGEAHALTKGKLGIGSFAWSPDGTEIAFTAGDAPTAAEDKKKKDKDDAEVMDHDGHHSRLWLLKVSDGKAVGEPRALTPETFVVAQVAWLPDGQGLVVSATDRPASEDDTHALYRIGTSAGAALRFLYRPQGPWGNFKISPDGKSIAYSAARVDGPQPSDLYVRAIDAPSTEPSRDLTASSLDRPVSDITWRQDGSIWVTAESGFTRKLYTIAKDGTAVASEAGPNPRGLVVARDGQFAFVGATATAEPEIFLGRAGDAPARATDVNADWDAVELVKPTAFHFASFDGLNIEGRLLRPLRAGAGPLPTVILVHGGPTGSWSDSIDSWGQLLAAHGFAAAYFNIRGSTGYGNKFVTMNRADWGGADYKDVMAGADYLVKQGIADPNRLGIGGWSYGGYMAEWAITQTSRFKAAVSGAGMVDLITEFSSENGPSYDKWFWGLPYEHSTEMLQHSPLLYLQRAHTPILILQGIADTTDPLDESTGLYRGLKFYGAPAELVEYPRENHGFHEQQHQIDRLNRIVAWYEKYLGVSTGAK